MITMMVVCQTADEELDAISEVGDNYVNIKVML